jgi:hypothetical protein
MLTVFTGEEAFSMDSFSHLTIIDREVKVGRRKYDHVMKFHLKDGTTMEMPVISRERGVMLQKCIFAKLRDGETQIVLSPEWKGK